MPRESVDAPHPLGVAAGEVIVHRDDVHVVAGDGVEVARERRNERLALARFHLGDLPVMQRDAADELNVEVTQSDGAHARLANGGERLGQKVVERLPVAVTRAKTLGERGELLVRAVLHLGSSALMRSTMPRMFFKLLPSPKLSSFERNPMDVSLSLATRERSPGATLGRVRKFFILIQGEPPQRNSHTEGGVRAMTDQTPAETPIETKVFGRLRDSTSEQAPI